MSMTVDSPITAFFPMVIAPTQNEPGVCSVAVDEGVFLDDQGIADGEQVAQMGTCAEKITTLRPTFAPSVRR